MDGDGDGELLVTALAAYRPDAQTGAAFLYGAEAPAVLDVTDYDTWFQGGEGAANLGGATYAGDLDGDGRAEVVLGYQYLASPDVAGSVRVFSGGALGASVSPDGAITQIDGVDGNQATGASMVVADVDGDGAADLVTGEDASGGAIHGRVLVLPSLLGEAHRSLAEAWAIEGAAESGAIGWKNAVGDLNGDGVADLVLGAPYAPTSLGEKAGKVYVFFGPLDGTRTSVTQADLVIEAETALSSLGLGVAVLDHDGDGTQDLVVVVPQDARTSPLRTGLVYVFAGPLSAGTLDPAVDAGVVYEDDAMLVSLGYAVDGCDLDGDGDEEIVVGAPDWGIGEPSGSSERDLYLPFAGRVQVLDGGPWRSPG